MEYDIAIIGAGPAGYVAAIRAGQLGMKTVLLEKNDIGGMCLNWGCIPTKALIESAKLLERIKSAQKMGIEGIDPEKISFNWPQAKKRAGKIVKKLTGGVGFLLKKNGVEVIQGEAIINSPNSITVNNQAIEAKNIIIATGSYPAPLEIDIPEEYFIEIDQLLFLEELPEKILLLGHGPVSLELAQFFAMTGRQVHLVSKTEDILPGVDPYLSDFILKKVKSQGIRIIVSDEIKLNEDNKLDASGEIIDFDLAINCSWRGGIVPENKLDLELTGDNFIKVDENLQSSVPGVYAAGDVNGLSYLAHVASAQGIHTVNHIKGVKGSMDINNFPVNIYTVPEISQIGLTEKEIRDKGLELKIGEFPLSANGKALTEDTADGFIRILSEKKFGEVLGVQIAASNATDLIAEAAAYMAVEATVYDVARTVHAHPTISEVFMEAGMDSVEGAIHK
jgi:dihydrolipoamide dehydrogenase